MGWFAVLNKTVSEECGMSGHGIAWAWNSVGMEEQVLQQEDALLPNKQQPWLEYLEMKPEEQSQSQQHPSICLPTLSVRPCVNPHQLFFLLLRRHL